MIITQELLANKTKKELAWKQYEIVMQYIAILKPQVEVASYS